MSRIRGNILIGLGIVLILAAIALMGKNQIEDIQAGKESEQILTQVVEEMQKQSLTITQRNENNESAVVPDPYDPTMTEKEIDGIMYVGYLSIPSLQLDLPIISEWSYSNLKIAPCRYYGSTKTDDLIIAAHNYKRHFGNIKTMNAGDEVIFTDMDGIVSHYEVVAVEVLEPTAVEDMTSGEYDLSLFTCTYGGKSRVTVRCDRKASV